MTTHDHDARDAHEPGEIEDHDRGLGFDLHTLATLRDRRAVLGLLGVGAASVGGAVLWGTRGGDATATGGSSASVSSTSSVSGSSSSTCSTEIPSETSGPYPGDGSNGPDVLTQSGIVRRDIRSSFGSSSGTAPGFPFRFTFVLRDVGTCQALPGLAVYAWHCNRDGAYSMYSQGITDQNYLRGVQVSDRKGKVHFRSIFPACYSGRWPHVHFEVYADRHAATSGGTPLVTSQLALPRREAMRVYQNVSGYSASVTNLNQVSLSSDMVFGDDGGVRQLAAMKGGLHKGHYRAKLVVPVDA